MNLNLEALEITCPVTKVKKSFPPGEIRNYVKTKEEYTKNVYVIIEKVTDSARLRKILAKGHSKPIYVHKEK